MSWAAHWLEHASEPGLRRSQRNPPRSSSTRMLSNGHVTTHTSAHSTRLHGLARSQGFDVERTLCHVLITHRYGSECDFQSPVRQQSAGKPKSPLDGSLCGAINSEVDRSGRSPASMPFRAGEEQLKVRENSIPHSTSERPLRRYRCHSHPDPAPMPIHLLNSGAPQPYIYPARPTTFQAAALGCPASLNQFRRASSKAAARAWLIAR